MLTVIGMVAAFFIGWWVGKHPEKAGEYGSAAVVRTKMAWAWVARRFKKTPPAGPPAGDS